MTVLRFVLGDQLSRSLSALRDADKAHDVIFLCEVVEEATYVKHHKKKIAFLFSAMRHFAEDLRREGFNVDYVKLDDSDNSGSFTGELERAVRRHGAGRVVATEPGEWRVLDAMKAWETRLGIPVEIRDDDRFLCSRAAFAQWAEERKSLRMEFFYREMRRKTGYLMDYGGEPERGRWNFDAENRKSLPTNLSAPRPASFEPDAITRETMALVADRFGDHFGDLEPFGFAVTRGQALEALSAFVSERLPFFGDYQDAMRRGEPFLFHSILSPYINCGLLDPREVCEAAIEAWRAGDAPLNAVEGFVRQIIGWREFIRGVYWLKMPDYERTNHFNATRRLPDFFWTAETDMACLAESIGATKTHAYAHHIQRLMVIGNFSLLAGLAPAEVEEWYLLVYADAYQWVELPNVHGMILFADGGMLASKPYAASGAYIDRMSDYCEGCRYDVKKKSGEEACPFNYLYWNFLIENEGVLRLNPRIGQIYRTLEKMGEERRKEILEDSRRFLNEIFKT